MNGHTGFLGREAELDRFRGLLKSSTEDERLWLICGQGGIGKTALLAQFQRICHDAQVPYVRLDARDELASEGEALLKALCERGQGLDGLKSLVRGEVWPLLKEIEGYSGPLNGLLDALKQAVPGLFSDVGPEVPSVLGQMLKVVTGLLFAGQARRIRELQDQLKHDPERTLLENLAQQGERRQAVLLLDTFEHALHPDARRIKSLLDVDMATHSGELATRTQPHEETAERFLAALIRVLTRHGWLVVVAGRHLGRVQAQQAAHALPGLAVQTLAQAWLAPLLGRYGVAVEAGVLPQLASQVHRASFGGVPLWLNALRAVLEAQLREGADMAALQRGALLERLLAQQPLGLVQKEADKVRCKADILEVLFRGEKLDMAQAWRLALPARLSRERLKALFPKEEDGVALFQRLQDLGLFIDAESAGRFKTLHEDVRDLLLWWGQSHELDNTPQTRADHRALLEVLKRERPDLVDLEIDSPKKSKDSSAWINRKFVTAQDANWSREAVAHAILGSERLEDFGVSQKEFLTDVSGSASLGSGEKWRIGFVLETLSEAQVFELKQVFQSEATSLEILFGKAISIRLIKATKDGLDADKFGINLIASTQWWLDAINKEDFHPGAVFGFLENTPLDKLKAFGFDREELEKFKCKMIESWHVHPESDAQCAGALCRFGIVLGQLNELHQAIAVYDEVVSRFAETKEPAIQEQVAKALLNKAITLGQLNEPRQEIAVYDELVSRFAEAKEPAIQEQVAKALVKKGYRLGQLNEPRQEIAVCDELVSRFAEAKEPAIQEQVAGALLNKGYRLGQLNEPRQAIAVYDEMVSRFAEAKEPAIQEQVAKALVNKAITLGQLNEPRQAIAVYDEVVRRFAETKEPAIQEPVAKALVNKAVILGQLEDRHQAIKLYDEVIDIFENSPGSGMLEIISKALSNKAVMLGQLSKFHQSIAVCNQVENRFGGLADANIQEGLACALLNKAEMLRQLGELHQAIAACDDVAIRFAEVKESVIQEQVGKALLNKAITLEQLNEPRQAIAVYDEVVSRFANSTEPALLKQVSYALNGKGFTLLIEAKKSPQSSDAISHWQTAEHLFQQALEHHDDKPMVLGNLGYVHHLLGRPDTAWAYLLQALAEGGERLYLGTLDDLAQNPIPSDVSMRQLLDTCWQQVQQHPLTPP